MIPAPPLVLIDGPGLLAYMAGSTLPSARPDDVAWAQLVADATNAAATVELEGAALTLEDWMLPDLRVGAYASGAERFKRREAPFGVAGFDVSGGAIRLSADDLIAFRTVLDRYSPTGGIAVG